MCVVPFCSVFHPFEKRPMLRSIPVVNRAQWDAQGGPRLFWAGVGWRRGPAPLEVSGGPSQVLGEKP